MSILCNVPFPFRVLYLNSFCTYFIPYQFLYLPVLQSFEANLLGSFLWLYFHLCLEVSIGNLSQSFLEAICVGSWPWPHPLISELSMVWAFRPANTPLDWNQKSCPYKRRGVVSTHACITKVRSGLASANLCTACLEYACLKKALYLWLV